MTILVTGASHGIGLFLCKEFAAQGHSIFGTYHKTLPTTDVQVNYTQVDISNEDSVISWIKSIDFKDSEKFVLLNCAGINYNSQIHKSDTPMWKAVIEVNLLGVYFTLKHIVPIMRSMKGGRIVNFAS
ncbi:MAG: SDR family oxidoreductase, partial [Candidatus Cloacimonadaceae bacterium]|nr:SDR family oxidoreductase [Candidatus Cloacimonadaceae bacterium]